MDGFEVGLSEASTNLQRKVCSVKVAGAGLESKAHPVLHRFCPSGSDDGRDGAQRHRPSPSESVMERDMASKEPYWAHPTAVVDASAEI